MTEIEKAREALFTHMLSVQAADDFLRKFESFSRAIAREEIEAHEERLMHEAMHGEVTRGRECDETGALAEEASAAGDSIGGELSDMTALARRLAEALDEMVEEMDIHLNRLPSLDSILFSRDVLAEARKHKLIE